MQSFVFLFNTEYKKLYVNNSAQNTTQLCLCRNAYILAKPNPSYSSTIFTKLRIIFVLSSTQKKCNALLSCLLLSFLVYTLLYSNDISCSYTLDWNCWTWDWMDLISFSKPISLSFSTKKIQAHKYTQYLQKVWMHDYFQNFAVQLDTQFYSRRIQKETRSN